MPKQLYGLDTKVHFSFDSTTTTLREELTKGRLRIMPFKLGRGPGSADADYWVEISRLTHPHATERLDLTKEAYDQVPGAIVLKSAATS